MLKGETIKSGAPSICEECGIKVRMGVYQSSAGFYYGSYCNCGPYSRETEYYPTRESCQQALDSGTIKWRY